MKFGHPTSGQALCVRAAGVEDTPWGARAMSIADPFGNRLPFHAKMTGREGW